MSPSQATETALAVEVTNLGGISETQVALDTGINVLSGRNATNRTSFLRAVMGALGSEQVSLKADADAGEVELTIHGETYTRRLTQQGDSVRMSGDPYLEEPAVADLFAFLLESNEARLAVSRSEDLRELIMRPVDVEAIKADIEAASAEKRRLDDRLKELEGLAEERPELEAKKQRLADDIEAKREELAAKREELAEMDGSVEASRQDKQALEEALASLQSVQSTIEETRFQLETERESRETLREELASLEAERESVSPADTEESLDVDVPSDIDARLESLRERRAALDSTASQLQSVIQFNEELLAGSNDELTDALQSVGTTDANPDSAVDVDDESDGDDGGVDADEGGIEPASGPTSQLLEGEQVGCWTCGSHVQTAQIEATLEQLRSLRREKLTERSEIGDRIDELTTAQSERESVRRERQWLVQRIEGTEAELEERADRIESLEAKLADLREEASELESTVESLDADRETAVLSTHKAITEIEFELSQLESDHDAVTERIETVESKLAERERLQAERESVSERLTELRTRIERLEDDAVEAFNTHMDNVLNALGYDNLERIWIERTTEQAREGRRLVERSVFQLHIVRSGPDGATYEDTIEHLSESEREVTGLVFALAGYLVHEVYDEVPIMVLDSLEAIDSDRIARLVEYFDEYAETILVALLPEDAAALDDEYHRVTDI